MIREIVLDTETTGFDPTSGDRIVEIGCVELVNHLPTGKVFHEYINPLRTMPEGAFRVHGLSDAFLADKPIFETIGKAFMDFVGDAPLVIHNASFDMKFLNFELKRMGLPVLPMAQAIDTLEIARARFPGSPATLDALSKRFGVDLSRRTKHGALLDAEILAEVYLDLIGARQQMFSLDAGSRADARPVYRPPARPRPLPPRITEAEAAAHAAFVDKLGGGAIWRKTE